MQTNFRIIKSHARRVAGLSAARHTSARLSIFLRPLAFLLIGMTASLLSGCSGQPVTNVKTESEAIEIIDVLSENGFAAEKQEVGEGDAKKWSIVVEQGFFGGNDAAQAMRILRDNGLPRAEGKGMEGASEEPGMFQSESAQRAQRLNELKTEIEQQLRILRGVTQVSVNIVLPEDNTLNINPYPATAGVLIVHKEIKPSFTPEQIQNLVARGVPNLKPENVTVSLSYQPARVVARQDLLIRKRNNIALAIGAALVVVLAVLIVLLLLRMRRQSAELAALREGDEPTAETDIEADEEEAFGLPASTQKKMDEAQTGDKSGRRLLAGPKD
jgi:type III secretion protein J